MWFRVIVSLKKEGKKKKQLWEKFKKCHLGSTQWGDKYLAFLKWLIHVWNVKYLLVWVVRCVRNDLWMSLFSQLCWGGRHSLMRALIADIKGMIAGLTFYMKDKKLKQDFLSWGTDIFTSQCLSWEMALDLSSVKIQKIHTMEQRRCGQIPLTVFPNISYHQYSQKNFINFWSKKILSQLFMISGQ